MWADQHGAQCRSLKEWPSAEKDQLVAGPEAWALDVAT